MAGLIEDYAIIGDTRTVALVDRTGSIDWFCAPRIDSSACFAALLGDAENGRWLIAPAGDITSTTRSYDGDTLVLETLHETPTGTVRVTDFMPPDHDHPSIHRIVECLERHRRHGDGAGRPLRLRIDRAVGRVHRGRAAPGGGTRRAPLPQRRAARGSRPDHRGRVGALGGQPTCVLADLVRQLGARALPLRQRRCPRADPAVVAGVGRALHLRGRVARRGRPVAHHAEGADVRAHRSGVCCRDDVAAGGDRRGPQLGLPLLVAARRHDDPAGVPDQRLRRGGRRLGSVAPPGGRRQPRRLPDHVRGARASGASPSSSSTGSPATRARHRCGSATRRRPSSSSTCSGS